MKIDDVFFFVFFFFFLFIYFILISHERRGWSELWLIDRLIDELLSSLSLCPSCECKAKSHGI